jgi:hypothetical protein
MIETVFHPRVIENKDWATILFVIALTMVAITKSAYGNRFYDFMKLLFSDKYNKIYRDTNNLMSAFTVIMFIINMISLAFFIQLVLHNLGYVSKNDWIVFIQIITFLLVFVLSKYLIEKIIATSFNIEEFVEQYNLQKVNYRTYIGLLILPLDIILFYSKYTSKTLIFLIIGIFLILNFINYIISLKNYQNLLFRKLFYFILYLCALEIAPYYFMFHWFTKS